MKVLYAIQGTGNGHVSRANEIIPLLKEKCTLDILLSGTQSDVGLQHPVKYTLKGMSFVFGKKGGIDFYATYQLLQSKKFVKEIKSLPVEDYDLVINDFEPVSAWACRLKNVPCVAMSHQYAVLHKDAPKPSQYDPLALIVLKHYAPCKTGIGFHFENYGNNIYTPVIRAAIRHAEPANMGHFTVYLPAYSDEKIIDILSRFKDIEWQIFSKHTQKSYRTKNCLIKPVEAHAFTESFINCEGVLCGAGFETPAEALFMGKKLMVIPMKKQYEQHCNAAAAASMGVPVIKSLKEKHIPKIAAWLLSEKRIQIDYKDHTAAILDHLLAQHKPTLPPGISHTVLLAPQLTAQPA
jgi:uncharacterized protein (TIGR00661 family)